MQVLVFNSGSSSLRLKVLDSENNVEYASCRFENIGGDSSYVKYENKVENKSFKDSFSGTFEDAVLDSLAYLTDDVLGLYHNLEDIQAIGHRIVQGKNKYVKPIVIAKNVLDDIIEFGADDPIHNLRSAKIIKMCLEEAKNPNNVGVFDTSFHSTIPKENFLYPIPSELYENAGIRKFGFHGISYQNVMRTLPSILRKDKNDINAVLVHLGSGCSMCAIKDGKSFDTTMGYTPLDGLMMSTRSGSVDPSVLPKICDYYKCDINKALEILNTRSGYKGICGESDVKTVCDNSENGDEMATLARFIASKSVKKNLGAMMAELGKVDAVVITGGMGVRNFRQRELFLSDLEILGLALDKDKNKECYNQTELISSDNSSIPIYVLPSDEEKEIAIQTDKTLKERAL